MATRVDCLPRKIKRIKAQADSEEESKDDEKTYSFYRNIIYPSILRLNNEKDKLNYSLWLSRLDDEKSDDRMILVKALFISVKSKQSLSIFVNPPPDDISELNVEQYDNPMELVKTLQSNTNEESDDQEVPEQQNGERCAAVATDMLSYTATKTSQYMAQSFYARSDFLLNSWYNPSSILVPSHLDHNEWELYLNHLYVVKPKDENADLSPKNTCEEIMTIKQVTKNIEFSFHWHPLSVLYNNIYRPKKLGCFCHVDQDVLNQTVNQLQIDETALGIVYKKSFPGYKMLNPKNYLGALMPDREYVYNMTGVRIIYDKLPDISLLLNTCPPKRECRPCAPPTPAAGCSDDDDDGGGGGAGTTAARDAGGPPGSGGNDGCTGGRPSSDDKSPGENASGPSGKPRKRCETAGPSDAGKSPWNIRCPLYDRRADKERRRRRRQKEKERGENGGDCADNGTGRASGNRDAPPSGRGGGGGGRRSTADAPDDKSKYDQFSPVGPAANRRNDGNASRRQPVPPSNGSNAATDDCGSGSRSDAADDTSASDGCSDSGNNSTVSNSSADESSVLTTDDNCSPPPPAIRRPRAAAAAAAKFRNGNGGECH